MSLNADDLYAGISAAQTASIARQATFAQSSADNQALGKSLMDRIAEGCELAMSASGLNRDLSKKLADACNAKG